MNLMYTNKRIRTLAGILCMLLSASVPAAIIDTLDTKVTIAIPEPTCSISVPGTVALGTLTPGMKINWLPDVSITVDCSGRAIKHAVYMQSQNTQTSGHDGIFLKRKSDNTDTGILLRLQGTNGSNRFTTDEKNPELIHEGTGTSTYPTKMQVDVPNEAKAGEVDGVVIFKLTYTT